MSNATNTGKTLAFTDENFDSQVLSRTDLVVVDFWASWCPPCKILGPVIDELASAQNGSVKIGKLDVDANPEITAEYQIDSIPSVLFFKGGALVKTLVGLHSKETYQSTIDELS